MHTYVYTYVCIHTYIYVCFKCLHTYTLTHTYTHTHSHTHTHTHLCTHIHTHTHTHTDTHTHTHTHILEVDFERVLAHESGKALDLGVKYLLALQVDHHVLHLGACLAYVYMRLYKEREDWRREDGWQASRQGKTAGRLQDKGRRLAGFPSLAARKPSLPLPLKTAKPHPSLCRRTMGRAGKGKTARRVLAQA
jgi:hypothetical protein